MRRLPVADQRATAATTRSIWSIEPDMTTRYRSKDLSDEREGVPVPVYQTAHYQVKPEAVEKVKAAIEEFVGYVREQEPTTWFYVAWQSEDDPSKFVHLFTFEDDAAQELHGQSEALKKFEDVYQPELLGGPVVFTDYRMVATNGGTTR